MLKLKEKTDKELLQSWKIGCNWIEQRMQITGTNKRQDGKKYNHKVFMKGLNRIIEIEDELIKRNVILKR